MSGKKSPPRQRAIPFYPVVLTLEMLAEAVVFCERCETGVMGSIAEHLLLHRTLNTTIHSDHAEEEAQELYVPATSETERVNPLQRYADAVFDLD